MKNVSAESMPYSKSDIMSFTYAAVADTNAFSCTFCSGINRHFPTRGKNISTHYFVSTFMPNLQKLL